MMLYQFHVAGQPAAHVGLNTGDDKRVLEWLQAFLKGSKPNSLTVSPPNVRISRAVLRDPDPRPDSAVVLELEDREGIGITRSTVEQWAADLEHGAGQARPYDAVPASDTVPVRGSSV